ncbi:putative bifunctional diguanylate cyclase/phosphodiesterase [Novispirillum sp. DQ9]|uniref:putative bifunctional diguanylate cyclase/phosphodiesterase n=1 Tax=Novispirillum sp. DQ9 TaxID=3398612 RepID=UPI003C7ACE8D
MFGYIARSLRTFTIGQFMLVLSGAVMVIAVAMVMMLSTFIERRAVGDLAHEEARQTSELIFQSLYSAMRKGWDKDEIADIIARLNSTRPDATIAVWRGTPVIDQYGEIDGESARRADDELLRGVLTTGQEALVARRDMLRYLYPVLVKEECQACHDAPVGAVNGVVDVTFPVTNLKVSLGFVIRSVIFYFAVVLSVILIVLYFKLRYFIAFPIAQFVQVIDDIIQHTDLNRRVEGRKSNLREVQKLSDHFNKLLSTIQDYHDRLETYSQRDPLTGLYNRRKFEEFLKVEVERARRSNHSFALIMLDVDNFKHINDTYGHPVGDLALKEMTAILLSRLRRTDVIARLGGDEFAILLPDTTGVQAVQVAENLHGALTHAVIRLPVGNTRLSASLGLVSFPENGTDVEKLNIAMDVAMYKAKRLGKNRVSTLDASEEGMVMEVFNKGQELQRALEEGRMVPFFQPICHTGDGRPYAYEVLARIRDGDVFVSAGEFIETAEELGLAHAVDQAVFLGALREIGRSGQTSARFFFNLSARTIADTDWLRGLPALVRQHGLEPTQIVLEITEREALPHFDTLLASMEELRKAGVRFALDDFGSGFSSFLYLKYLTVDYVKIEGSFVRHIATDSRDRIMVEHIHGMANQFGLMTIAEFVEDAETSRLLKEIGVDLGQGYHYGHPLAAPAVVEPRKVPAR